MDKRVVPIVMAVNNAYTYFGYIAIFSLIQHADSNTDYKIYVFATDMHEDNKNILESLTCENVEVRCVDISEYTKGVTLKASIHLSVETYYRLFIPVVLPQYEKILYLDADICVLANVAELFRCDLDGRPIGAVRDVYCGAIKKHSIEIGDLDYRKTFNAGILVMDTRKFEEERIRDKCLRILQEDYKRKIRKFIFADQDALNVVLYENVKILEDEWNVQSQFAWRPDALFDEYKERYFELLEKAKILHFAGDKKPWMYPELPKAEIFWETAQKTEIFRELLIELFGGVRKKADKMKCFDSFQFPYEKVAFGSRVAIYGAGVVGRSFMIQNSLTKYAEVVLWVDRNANNISDVEVSEVKEVINADYDSVIVAIDDEDIAVGIIDNLKAMGISANKIVWDEYKKNNNK